MGIRKDIEKGIISEIEKVFIKNGVEYSHVTDISELFDCRIIEWLNFRDKLVLPKERTVHYSKELGAKMHSGLDEGVCRLIKIFEDKFTQGIDINLHQSKGIYDSSQYDMLFNTWNIRHLHLSDKVAANYKEMSQNRSNYLLFYIVTNGDVYFMDVLPHPHREGFADFNFLEIAYNNDWMAQIGASVMEGVEAVKPEIKNSKDIYEYHKHCINVSMFMFEGKCYKVGMGITTAGNKLVHSLIRSKIIRKINTIIAKPNVSYKSFQLSWQNWLGIVTILNNGKEESYSLS